MKRSGSANRYKAESQVQELAVPVAAEETQNFINDVMKNSHKDYPQVSSSSINKKWFWLGFLGGAFVSCLGIFFVFTTVYFIQSAILEKSNSIYQKVICESK